MVEYTMHEYWSDYPHFPPNPRLLLSQYLNKGKVLEAKIFGIFTPQLGAIYRQNFIEIREINWARLVVLTLQ
jgi:hypothetical protein